MKSLLIIALLCCTCYGRLLRAAPGPRHGTHEVEENVVINDEILDQMLKDLMKSVQMASTTTTSTEAPAVPESVDPFDVEFLRPHRPVFPRRLRPHRPSWNSDSETEREEEQPHPQNSNSMSSMFSFEFLKAHDEWAQSCMKYGCKLCQAGRNSLTGEIAEVCRRIPAVTSMMTPVTHSGGRLFNMNNKLTMKPHGFMEYRAEYSMRGREVRTFKVTLLQIAEAIKMVMVAKDMVLECKPKLNEFNTNESFAEEKESLPDAISSGFMEDMEKFAKNVIHDGGNFCLGTKNGDNENDVSNCMTIDWKPACGSYNEGKPTMRVVRFEDDAVIVLEFKDEDGQLQEKSYRLVKSDLIKMKQEANMLLLMVAGRSSQDPVAFQQMTDLMNDMFDFVSNNSFHP